MSITLSASGAPASVVLPNPQIGMSQQHNSHTNFSLTMSGNVFSHKKTPRSRFLLTFNNLVICPSDKADELLAFIAAHLDDLVGIDDLNSQAYSGYIVNQVHEVQRTSEHFKSMTIEYEGNPV